tara:strand:+ start:1085 stop:2530 length:1446 start_codon:yes stop_codon:yes gene_type:complete
MPNGIIKMLYSGKEDQQFTQNPDINFFRSVYKSYSNFVKIPENIQVETNYNINTTKNITLDLSNYDYDLIGDLFLYFKLKTTITNNITDFIDKIEFYSSDFLLDTITKDILNLYSNIYYNKNKHKIYNLIGSKNNRNTFYIPLHFHFLHKSTSYIPLYLLRNENINIKIHFKKALFTDVIADDIDLIANYFILENQDKRLLNKNYLFMESINYMENVQLDVSVKEDISNIVNLSFEKYCKSFIFVFKNCNINNIKLYINDLRLSYTSQQLKYISFLHSNLKNNAILNNNNENINNTQVCVLPFTLFKNDISGYINLDTINKLYIEIYPFVKHTKIHFNVTTVFTNYYFAVTTDLLTSDTNQSPDITIYTNVLYNITNTNCDIIVTVSDPTSYIDSNTGIPTTLHYEGFNDSDNTLLVDDETYTELYYCHKISNANPTSIIYGKLKILTDSKRISALGYVDIYSINYNLFTLEKGKLYETSF